MTTKASGTAEMRIRDNKHFASLLRRRLESRHGNGALREMLARMTDAELVDAWLKNEQQGRENAAKRHSERAANE